MQTCRVAESQAVGTLSGVQEIIMQCILCLRCMRPYSSTMSQARSQDLLSK
jgi:hypothetical protein